jgi:hypothetical protein
MKEKMKMIDREQERLETTIRLVVAQVQFGGADSVTPRVINELNSVAEALRYVNAKNSASFAEAIKEADEQIFKHQAATEEAAREEARVAIERMRGMKP